MNPAIVLLFIVVIGFLLFIATRHRPAAEDAGMHRRRIGDGLRHLRALEETYAVMTPALLSQIPDSQVLEAVLANLWAKMRPGLENASEVMRGLSLPRQALYAVYTVTGSLRQHGAAQTLRDEAEWFPQCAQALRALEMDETATLLQSVQAGDAQAAEAYLESFSALDGKGRLVWYVREHVEAFCDEVPSP